MGVEGWNGESQDKISTMTIAIVHLACSIFVVVFSVYSSEMLWLLGKPHDNNFMPKDPV